MAGIVNDVLYALNADFTGGNSLLAAENNGLVANGKMWIGSTATNAGGTHINVGGITSPDGSVSVGYVSPNITLQVPATTPPAMVLIETQTVENVATIDFTTGFGTYNSLFVSYSLGPVTNNNAIEMLQSVDGGASHGGLFSWGLNYFGITSTVNTNVSNNNGTPIKLTDAAQDFSNTQASGFIFIRNFNINYFLSVCYDSTFVDGAGTTWNRGIGMAKGIANVNALRFQATAGNITGTISVYGLDN